MPESIIEAYLFYEDGEIVRDCSSAGMIHGVHYAQIEQILEEVYSSFDDWFSDYIGDSEDFLSGHGCIYYTIKNISWDEGQQSFPESGLWDFLPHWDFNIEITKHERFPVVQNDEHDICSSNPESPF